MIRKKPKKAIDEGQFEAEFLSLLAHEQAGGTITLEIEARQHELLIRISDNGLGIAPDALPHVFNMYSAAAPTAGSSVKRLGVGLAITRSLVELHGGAIRAESARARAR